MPTSSSTDIGRTGVSDAGGEDQARKIWRLSWTAPYTRFPTLQPCERSTSTYTGLDGRKRNNGQQLALPGASAVEPWETLKVDLLRIGMNSLAGNEILY